MEAFGRGPESKFEREIQVPLSSSRENWRAVVMTCPASGLMNDWTSSHPDRSFRFVAPEQYLPQSENGNIIPIADSLALSDATNLTNKSAKFSCNLKNVSAVPEGLNGSFMHRPHAGIPGRSHYHAGPAAPSNGLYNVPRADLSRLEQRPRRQPSPSCWRALRAVAGCGMTLLVCLQEASGNASLAQGFRRPALAEFLRNVRS